jgi:hypothetical protein
VFHIILVVSCIGAIVSDSRRYHAILAPVSLLLFIGYVGLLFARL